jgi:hypothetical protein
MISLPNHPQLLAELSLPLVFRLDTGKLRLEQKDKMRARGVKSPDFGDSLAYCFAEDAGDWQPVMNDPRETSLVARLPAGVTNDWGTLPEQW